MTQQAAPPRRPGQTPTARPAPSARMNLAAVRKGVRPAPDRILLVGTEGIGKSTFGAAAPQPIFIAAEDGVRHLDVESFPEPKTFSEVLDALRVLATDPHHYRTVVLDTLDWIEPLVWAEVCQRNGWESIETPGYGKGYGVALEEWRKLLVALDRLRTEKGMECILLAHASIKPFSNPAGNDYSRYECKLQKSAAALVREWCDSNLFAVHEEFVSEAKGIQKSKAVSTGLRLLKTERTAAWDAKNRYGLPPELPLDYSEYAKARAAGQPASPDALRAEIDGVARALALDEAGAKWVSDSRASCGEDAVKLASLLNVLRNRLAAKPAATGASAPEGA